MSRPGPDPAPEPLRGPILVLLTPMPRDVPWDQRLARLLKAARDLGFRVDYRNPTLRELLGGDEPEGA